MSADAPVKFATDREQIERLRKLGRILRDNGSFMTTPVGSFGGNELLMISDAAEAALSHPAALERARAEGAAEMRDFVQRLTHDLRGDMLAKMGGTTTEAERLRWRTYEEAYAAFYVTIGEKTIETYDVVERARAEERERCAMIPTWRARDLRAIINDPAKTYVTQFREFAHRAEEADSIAAAIRALGPRPSPEAEALDDALIDRFASALKAKMAETRAKGKSGWERDDWEAVWRSDFIVHLAKGDPRDCAIYLAFMWHHGWSLTTPPAMTPDLRESNWTWMRGIDAHEANQIIEDALWVAANKSDALFSRIERLALRNNGYVAVLWRMNEPVFVGISLRDDANWTIGVSINAAAPFSALQFEGGRSDG